MNTLKQLVEKAVGNGWLKDRIRDYEVDRISCNDHNGMEIPVIVIAINFNKYPISTKISLKGYGWMNHCVFSLSDLLFNHEFMKAVCGEECVTADFFIGTIEGISRRAYLNAMNHLFRIESPQERLEFMKQFVEGK